MRLLRYFKVWRNLVWLEKNQMVLSDETKKLYHQLMDDVRKINFISKEAQLEAERE